MRAESQTKMISNDSFGPIRDTNRDKELIERVDQKISKFDQILNQLKERLDLTKMETIIREYVKNEFQKINVLNESLKRAQNEKQSLREEILRLRAIHSTEIDITFKHMQYLNEFKDQLTKCLPNRQIFESFIDYKNEFQKKFLRNNRNFNGQNNAEKLQNPHIRDEILNQIKRFY